MWLSTIFDLRCINFLLGHAVQWGVLALIILFQLGAAAGFGKDWQQHGVKQMFIREEALPAIEQAIGENGDSLYRNVSEPHWCTAGV